MMYRQTTRRIISITAGLLFLTLSNFLQAQNSDVISGSEIVQNKEPRPFKILTEGKRITIQSNQEISRILAWSASGHRIVEQTTINSSSFSFHAPAGEKFVFVMVQFKNGKHYTEKIGIQ